jgi:gluconolactonase
MILLQWFLLRGCDALKCFAGKYECASYTVQAGNALCPQDTRTFQRRVLTRRASALTLVPLLILWGTTALITGTLAQNNAPDPDLQRQDVPHGKTSNFVFKNSRVYPGTEHNVTVYVPAQYDASKPACVMIFQDGLGFNAPTVFDNLIAKKQMPVCVAIGINPGVAPPARPGALPRYNRSVEYDTPDGTYARFLVDEILPEVGKTLNLSRNPDDRGLAGASSGGIAAFTAAWERPDQFRRVYSVVGSFTDLAGGDTYPSKIRKSEPKPLRVYLQDNDHDQDIYSGSWPLSNEEVAAALKYAGYDHQYAVGQGGHDGRPGSLIFPEVLRWLWRDYPTPIKANTQTGQPIAQILAPNEDWQEIKGTVAISLHAGTAGSVYFTNYVTHTITHLDENGIQTVLYKGKTTPLLLAVAPDGRVISNPDNTLMSYDANGKETVLARNVQATCLVIDHQGTAYFQNAHDGSLWQMPLNGQKRKLTDSIKGEGSMTLTPDQSLLITAGGGPRKTLMSWRIQPDGTLADGQPFFDLTIPYNQTGAQATALVTDTNGWLYVATPAGIQICDQAGRVNGIIALPEHAASVTGLTWGGANHDTLYAACNGKLYRRKLRAKGVLPFEAPITPPAPRL